MAPRLVGVHRLHYRMGGAESVHLDHLDLFRARGWDCAEFAMDHPQNQPSDWQSYFPPRFDPPVGLAGIPSLPRFFHSVAARRNFARLLDDFRPDVVHIHGIYVHLTPSILKPALDRGIPIVFTLHDYKLICPAHHFYRRGEGVCERCRGGKQWQCATRRCTGGPLVKDTLYAADGWLQWHRGVPRDVISRFVGPCRFTADKFVEHGFPRERMRVVQNFFENTDDTPVTPDEVARVRAAHPRFALYFGRLSVEKGLDTLIDAAAHQRIPLVLVGDGPQREALERQARALDADVTFTGHLKGSALWAFVEAATAVVLPSVWYEIAPKSILEAQARGKPVIVSAIGGLPEMVQNAITGLLAAPGDRADLGRALRRLFDMDTPTREAMGARAKHHALTTFTRERYYREMTAVYRELLPALAAA